MINEYIRYRIAADQAEAFLGAYEEASKSLRASPNCLGYEISRCAEDPEHFVLRIQWDSVPGHLEGFRKSALFPAFFKAIGPFMKGIEEMRHYELTPLQWSR